ncbi:MAG: mechanosensitive ion channel [Rhodospirillales bacterium]|nr:mechanosensitive ion channel [Rhodospirillales bacterium]MBO6785264.1 mechanosensitive ion channel [Rhodospirillales bacterium]
MKKILSWITVVVFAALQLALLAPDLLSSSSGAFRVAIVGPMSGADEAQGTAMLAGARKLINTYNRERDTLTPRVELAVFDDKNDPELARELAAEIADDPDILAVLGHQSDEASAVAAPIYAEKGLPAITGSSGLQKVTFQNDWYFRVGLTTANQGTFLANYIGRVLKEEEVYVIRSTDPYGDSMGEAVVDELNFQRRLSAYSVKVLKQFRIDPASENLAADIQAIAEEIMPTYARQPVVVAVPEDIAADVVFTLQSNQRRRLGKTIPYQIIGPDSLGKASVLAALAERRTTRFGLQDFAEGMRAVAPFLEDVANQRARDFRYAYRAEYKAEPSVIAAGFHDAAAVLVRALGQLVENGTATADTKAAREAVRQFLADINTPANAVIGVTGPLYFNRDGNAIKTVPIGVYRDRRLVSTPVQLSPTGTIDREDGAPVYQIFGGYFTPTRVVPTGVQINKIRNVDLKARTAEIDFNFWFRHQGDLNLNQIVFPNAVSPIELGDPIDKSEKGGQHYRLYRVEGTFSTDFLGPVAKGSGRIIGFQMRHAVLNRERLILIPDLVGMDGGGESLQNRVARVLDLGDDDTHQLRKVDIFLDAQPVEVMGNPEYIGVNIEGFSRINLAVRLGADEISLTQLIDPDFALRAFLLFGFLIGVVGVAGNHFRATSKQKWFWFPTAVLSVLFLFVAEPPLLGVVTGGRNQNPVLADITPYVVRIMWWMVPAWLLARFMELFVWQPLEQQTKREIPRVVRAFVAGTFYTLAILGITAFVFDQRITSLLATSGVLAMIIGLAIQMNISNVFSGIAINVERPFRIGDWVKIEGHEPGQIVNITWRTTRLETIDKNIICIPNAMASDQTLENLSYPDERYRAELMVHVDPGAKPEWVEKILMDAVMSVPEVLPEPAAIVQFDGVMEWSADFAVRFFCPNYAESIPISAQVWRQIVRNLKYAGFESVIHEEFTLFHLTETAKRGGDVAPMLITDVEVFEPFGDAEIKQLCKHMIRHRLEPQRTVIEQGSAGDSLFIVVEGALKAEITMDDGKVIEVGRLGPGDFFGEMALLTGEPRGATITTITPSQVYEVRKEHIQPVIEQYPDIQEDLSQILTRRELENLRRRNEHFASIDEERNLASKLLSKITDFFGIADRKANAAPKKKEPADADD